jgi:hypothetical protein
MWPQVFPNLVASLLWALMTTPAVALAAYLYHRWLRSHLQELRAHMREVRMATTKMHQVHETVVQICGLLSDAQIPPQPDSPKTVDSKDPW